MSAPVPPPPVSRKSQLVRLLRERSVQHGAFLLASGRRSSFYIDARRTTMSAAGLEVIGESAHGVIRDAGWPAQLVGGLTLGADPIAYAVAYASRHLGPPHLDAFSVRKHAKRHGTGRRIEGCFFDGARVVVVEDVITTGGSVLSAIDAVAAAGGQVSGVLALTDRGEGGREAIEDAGHAVRVLVTLADLGLTLPDET